MTLVTSDPEAMPVVELQDVWYPSGSKLKDQSNKGSLILISIPHTATSDVRIQQFCFPWVWDTKLYPCSLYTHTGIMRPQHSVEQISWYLSQQIYRADTVIHESTDLLNRDIHESTSEQEIYWYHESLVSIHSRTLKKLIRWLLSQNRTIVYSGTVYWPKRTKWSQIKPNEPNELCLSNEFRTLYSYCHFTNSDVRYILN